MNKRIVAVSVLAAVLFVSAIAGTIVYYNSKVASLNSQILNQNIEIENLTSQISNLTAQMRSSKNNTSSYEKLTIDKVVSSSLGIDTIYNWSVTLDITNTGNSTAIINNVIIGGQSYSSFNPVPTVNPSIKNGYSLAPKQSITITIREINSTANPKLYLTTEFDVLTAIGNSYSYYQAAVD
jgi:hypothetical protein